MPLLLVDVTVSGPRVLKCLPRCLQKGPRRVEMFADVEVPKIDVSGQMKSQPHTTDLPPNGGLVRELGPLISGKSRLVKH